MSANQSEIQREIQIQKVQRLSRFARGCCTAILGFLILAAVVTLGLILFGPNQGIWSLARSSWRLANGVASFEIKITMVLFTVPMFALSFLAMHRFYRLFDNLVQGAIYTRDNVRHILQIGQLWMLGAIVNMLTPVLTMIPVWMGFIDERSIIMTSPQLSLVVSLGALKSLAPAGLVILLAWVMDVGRQTQDEAVLLRHEAELTV